MIQNNQKEINNEYKRPDYDGGTTLFKVFNNWFLDTIFKLLKNLVQCSLQVTYIHGPISTWKNKYQNLKFVKCFTLFISSVFTKPKIKIFILISAKL